MNKNKKIIILLIFVTLVLVAFGFFTFTRKKEAISSVTVTTTDNLLQSYYDSYKDPFVIQIRTTLNNYLKDPKTLSESLLGGTGDGKSGLNNFSSDYYKGRFVVMDLRNSAAGGKFVDILFPDKPNKVFLVWVYKLGGNGGYEMREIAENPYYSQEKIQYYLNQYPSLLQDKIHSL